MVRFFCDRCEVEVEGQQDLMSFTAEVGDVTVAAWRTRRDLCVKCLEETKDMVSKFFAKVMVKPRRTV